MILQRYKKATKGGESSGGRIQNRNNNSNMGNRRNLRTHYEKNRTRYYLHHENERLRLLRILYQTTKGATEEIKEVRKMSKVKEKLLGKWEEKGESARNRNRIRV